MPEFNIASKWCMDNISLFFLVHWLFMLHRMRVKVLSSSVLLHDKEVTKSSTFLATGEVILEKFIHE